MLNILYVALLSASLLQTLLNRFKTSIAVVNILPVHGCSMLDTLVSGDAYEFSLLTRLNYNLRI